MDKFFIILKKIKFIRNFSFEKIGQIFKIAIIGYNVQGCLRFFTFIFQTLSNLAKYTSGTFKLLEL